MKRLLSRLPALALALVAVAAFAFNMPAEQEGVLHANINGNWVPISDQTQYQCSEVEDKDCVARFYPNGAMVPGTLEEGEYSPL